ncbi:MAG: hypothetical protein R3F19_25265 [Verrucomicrobiales bacterium]
MIVVMIGGLAMTGSIALLHARMQYTEQHLSSVQRRIAESNARALTREYLLENVIASSSGSGGTFTPGTSWGQTTIPSWSTAAMNSTAFPAGNNLVSSASGFPYAATFLSTISDGADSSTYKAYMNSRSPLLSGDLLVVHQPFDTSLAISGSLDVIGRSVIYAPASPNSYNFTTEDFAVPRGTTGFSLNDGSGNALPGSNFPLGPETAGPSVGDLGYSGTLNVIDNSANPGNSLYAKLNGGGFSSISVSGTTPTNNRGVVSLGDGNVSITLDDDFMTNVIITDATAVTLVGQNSGTALADADLLPAIMILILQGGGIDLTTISFQNQNNRRLHLGVKKTSTTTPVQFNFTSSLSDISWRLLLTAESTPIVLNKTVGGSMNLYGGIRTNGSVTVASGTSTTLRRELDPKLLNRLADRRAWVELYK